MHVCMFMTKVIPLSDDAYNELKRLKKGNESFSDIVLKMTKKEKKPLKEFFGKWPEPKELDKIKKDIETSRKKAKMRDVKF